MAGSIGSRPPRDLFVAVMPCLPIRFPLGNMGPSRHNPGSGLLDGRASRAGCLGLRGSFAAVVLVRSPNFPAIAAVIASAVSEALRKLSNCGIKSGPAGNDLVARSAKHAFKLFN